MNESEDSFNFKGNNYDSIEPKRVRIVLPLLEKNLGELSEYALSDEEWLKLGQANTLSIESMEESDVAKYLNKFRLELEEGKQTAESLAAHKMFRAVLTKALKLE